MVTQPEYFGGTPTSQKGYVAKKSAWARFLDGLWTHTKPLAEPVGDFAGKAVQKLTDPYNSGSFQAGVIGLESGYKAKFAGASDETAAQMSDYAFRKAIEEQTAANFGLGAGPTGVAIGAAEQAWSYGVARPAATAALLADPESQLYKEGTIQQLSPTGETEIVPTREGFQWDDIRQAWNRSEDVSFGMAVAANPITEVMPGLDLLYSIGGVNDYDPWSVYEMSQAQENPYYRFITGATDFGLELFVPPAAKVARLAAIEKLGMRSTIKSADDITRIRGDYDYHKSWLDSDGAEGHATTFGMIVDEIAELDDVAKIRTRPIVANSSGVDKTALSSILAKTNDRDTVANILLANMGDVNAIRSLAEAAPDHVWTLADMNSVIRNMALDGEDFMPTGAALDRVNQIFDSAISRDEYFSRVRDLFTTAVGDIRVVRGPGSTWMPSRSVTVEKIRNVKGDIQYAVKSGDYSGTPKWTQFVADAGPGAPTTVFLQWASSRQPLGHVSLSGARPDDVWTELSAQFDSIPELRGKRTLRIGDQLDPDGNIVPVTITAEAYRKQLTDRMLEASRVGQLKQAWQQMEDELVSVIANTIGVDGTAAQQFIRGYRSRAERAVASMGENGGYLFDDAGSRILVDPVTQRQLLNSFPTLPLEEIRNGLRDELSGAAIRGAGDLATAAFDAGMKFFRTNVLFRPGYTGKNSILEPALSSWLAHGTIFTDEGLMSTLGNFGRNRVKDLKRAGYLLELDTLIKRTVKREPASTRKQLRNEMRELVRQRHDVERVIDDALIELDNLRNGRYMNTQTAANTEAVRGILVDAQIRLNKIEAALDGRVPEWRQIVEPANLRDIRQKLMDYEDIVSGKVELPKEVNREEVVGMIAGLQAQYDNLIQEKLTDFSDPARKLQLLQNQTDAIDRKISSVQVELGRSREKLAKVSGLAGFEGSGQGYMTLNIGGERIQVPAAFSDREFDFGSAYRAEASAATTNRLTYDPSYRAQYEMGRWERTGQITTVDPTSPVYWDELAHVANRYLRDDKLITLILQGKSRSEVAKWLTSDEGIKYQKTMGKRYLVPKERYADVQSQYAPVEQVAEAFDNPKPAAPGERGIKSALDKINNPGKRKARRVIVESTTELDEVYRIVNQYFPDKAVQQKIAAQEVTAGYLQRAMGERTDLSRIAGEDLLYVPKSNIAMAYNSLNRGLDKIWNFIATMPEDRLMRWPFYQREFRGQMQQRTDILSSQGVKMTVDQFDAMRQASHRAALEQLEKTFYNIRRYNTPVYMSRFFLSFPGAFFNSIYRYGRFSLREPERVFQAGLFAYNILDHMGVDADGNTVKNPLDAEYLLIPGTKRSETDKGMLIPVAAFAAMTVNAPSLSYAATLLTSAAVAYNPTTEEILKESLGDGAFEEIFPYGIPDNPLSAFFGSYQKDLWRAGRGESDEDFLTSAVQIYANEIALWEKNGATGDSPTFEEALQDTRSFYLSRARNKFVNAFTINQQVPGQLMRDAWYDIRDEFPGDPQKAREEYIKQYGEWARWYTYSSSDYTAYVPATQDAYDRIWVDYRDLTRSVVALAGEDLDMLSLMAIGTEGNFSEAVSNYMRDNPLPGDNIPVISRMNIEKFDNIVRTSEGWDLYGVERPKFDAEIARLRVLRDDAKTEEARDYYREWIDATEDSWREWVKSYSIENEAWGFDYNSPKGNRGNNAATILRKVINDEKFSKNEGKQPLWQNIKLFVDARDSALEAVRDTDDSEYKKEIKRSFVQWVNDEILFYAPEFTSSWQRYFAREWEVE